MEDVTVDYLGKQITAALSSNMWHVSIGGTALTKFPAQASESAEQVRDRVLQWLKEHPEMLDRDQIVLGGG
jgi:hypothetical protein